MIRQPLLLSSVGKSVLLAWDEQKNRKERKKNTTTTGKFAFWSTVEATPSAVNSIIVTVYRFDEIMQKLCNFSLCFTGASMKWRKNMKGLSSIENKKKMGTKRRNGVVKCSASDWWEEKNFANKSRDWLKIKKIEKTRES